MDKYAELREKQTTWANCDVFTEDIIRQLQKWEEKCDFTISSVGFVRLELHITRLPDDLDIFVRDIYAICPDTVDQGFGCIADEIQMHEETGQEMRKHFQDLIKGVDLNKEDYGLELMKRSLQNNPISCFGGIN
jgi:hypothetical protein